MSYTGTLLTDLQAAVERAERKSTDEMLAKFDVLIAECDPPLYLANVMTHLANHHMTTGDVNAWHLCLDIQECFWSGKTAECHNCGQLEGLHEFGGACGSFSSEDRNERTIRVGLDSWIKSQAGC